MPLYDVHAYAIVRVKVPGVEADTPAAATNQVFESVPWRDYLDRRPIIPGAVGIGNVEEVEYADDIDCYLVDEMVDGQRVRSFDVRLDAKGRTVTKLQEDLTQ